MSVRAIVVALAGLALLLVSCGQPNSEYGSSDSSSTAGSSPTGSPQSAPSAGSSSEGKIEPASAGTDTDLVAETKKAVAEIRELNDRLKSGESLSAEEKEKIATRLEALEAHIRSVDAHLAEDDDHDH